ncbi:hypothetical protein B5F40_12980 [Gordonibacter sp. An230]|uniref:DUF1385 domain-containing protein n=1 Tax=Gordonibacter sp. An230 TaxID=1965592 RepID=UPI000B3A5E7C|nr:DUF1385 domain-containing protein [Gordonibacter sp. An230]OUO88052.1 hypothetical protein B5F40_12980 [Gordonibacter sp. An230]
MAGRKSDLSRAFSEDGALKTHVGGQALIEGVMMRGKRNWSVAVREPNGGIYVEEHDLPGPKGGAGWLRWPLVRGCRAMVESLVLGYKALEIAALHAFGEEESDEPAGHVLADGEPASHPIAPADGLAGYGDPSAGAKSEAAGDGGSSADARIEAAGDERSPAGAKSGSVGDGNESAAPSQPLSTSPSFSWKDDFGRPDTMIDALGAQRALEVVEEPEPRPEKGSDASGEAEFGKREMAVSMALGLVLGVVLFIAAPAFLTNLIVGEYDSNTLLWNVVDGLLRVGVFVLYLWLIGRMSDIKRMFGYHGAEHKAIHCYEHGLPLTPENARSFPRLHVRCGTAFLIMVMIIAIFVYTVTPINGLIELWGVPDGAPKLLLVILARILLMPVIAGVSYEITVKWAGTRPENPLVKVVLWPGMQMQYLTTNEPDDGQIECAIAAMERVLERERAEEGSVVGRASTDGSERAPAVA